jgi:hypothetical protein
MWGRASAFSAWTSGPVAVRLIARMAAGTLLVVAASATITYARQSASLEEMNGAWLRFRNRSVRNFPALSPPIDGYAPRGSQGDVALIRYIYECTAPDDRVWVLSDLYTFPYYAERRLVRHLFWGVGLSASPDDQRKTIEQVERDEVPIVLSLGEDRPLESLEAYPLVREYVAARYTKQYTIAQENGRGVFRLLTDSRRTPTGTYASLGLPCFR